MKVVCIVQARMGSTRLPGKVLMDLAGAPVIARCLARLGRARRLDQVAVATTILAADQALVNWCAGAGVACLRGDPEDLLDRYYQAARELEADVVVRCTSDCPIADPDLVDRAVGEFLAADPPVDYASTRLPVYRFPRGLDTEVMSMAALERAWRADANPAWREHVTPYMYFNPDQFAILGVPCTEGDFSQYRLTVDTPEDLTLMRLIYEHFGHDRFTWREAVDLLAARPDWAHINAEVRQKMVQGPDGPAG